MSPAALALGLVALGLSPEPGDAPPALPPPSTFAGAGDDAMQELVILGEARPLIVRLRVLVDDRSFRSYWSETVRIHLAWLDRNGDGKVAVEEADAAGLAAPGGPLAPPPATTSTATARARPEVDANPKDGVISAEELAAALRGTMGPFRIQVEGNAARKSDALFDHLDLDKDGQLARAEMAAIVGSLRRLDSDDNELIGADEVAILGTAPDMATGRGGSARDPGIPPVIELEAGEVPLRLVRSLIKRYDTGSARGPGKTDSRLSPDEFALSPKAFAAADVNGDGVLDTDELRRHVAAAPRDAIVDVLLPADSTGRALVRATGGEGGDPKGLAIRQLGDGVVEIDAGQVRLDIHVDDGAAASDAARQVMKARFDAADANQDGYLEESEVAANDGQVSPLAGLFRPLDRDGDGKVYPAELDDHVTRQADLARGRLTLTAANEGRALFGMLDLDRDRRLGAREVLETFARVSACDRDRDGRVSPDEIPHHIQLTLSRGDLSKLLTPAADNVVVQDLGTNPPRTALRPGTGPDWFRKMDRNRDGDVSRREFLGTREQFDRVDRDHDGLVSPAEAEAARPVKGPGG